MCILEVTFGWCPVGSGALSKLCACILSTHSAHACFRPRYGLLQKQDHLCAVLPKIARLLPPESLMGRTVVAHNDLHDRNIMRRAAGGGPGDLVIIDFDRVMVNQACFGSAF